MVGLKRQYTTSAPNDCDMYVCFQVVTHASISVDARIQIGYSNSAAVSRFYFSVYELTFIYC